MHHTCAFRILHSEAQHVNLHNALFLRSGSVHTAGRRSMAFHTHCRLRYQYSVSDTHTLKTALGKAVHKNVCARMVNKLNSTLRIHNSYINHLPQTPTGGYLHTTRPVYMPTQHQPIGICTPPALYIQISHRTYSVRPQYVHKI
jgi:hypothetical protein